MDRPKGKGTSQGSKPALLTPLLRAYYGNPSRVPEWDRPHLGGCSSSCLLSESWGECVLFLHVNKTQMSLH